MRDICLIIRGIRTYTWDAENRLVAIAYLEHPEKHSRFQYDGLNRRAVLSETNGASSKTTTFLWDGIESLRGQTGAEATWYYAQGEIHGNRKLYYVQDRLGSVRETVGEEHVVTSRMSYTPYGVTETRLPPFIGKAPEYRYAGLFYHEASGLYLAVFRVYDPGAGRWVSRDPIGEVGGVNLFSYSNNDPANLTDKVGYQPCLECISDCISSNDPFNDLRKATLSLLGAPIPKVFFGLPRGLSGASEYTTLPSAISHFLYGSNPTLERTLIRSVGRLFEPLFIFYGDYLFAIEGYCLYKCL